MSAPAPLDLFGAAPTGAIVRTARLSACGDFRWTLTRAWAAGSGRVCFVGLNPSTADHARDDPTVRRWTHFARAWGYGGFVAVNLYPFRSSTPAACRAWSRGEGGAPDPIVRDRLLENEAVVVTEAEAADIVVVCWGAGAWDPAHVLRMASAIAGGSAPRPVLHAFGTAADGSPKHPMARGRHRIHDDARPVFWRPRGPVPSPVTTP